MFNVNWELEVQTLKLTIDMVEVNDNGQKQFYFPPNVIHH